MESLNGTGQSSGGGRTNVQTGTTTSNRPRGRTGVQSGTSSGGSTKNGGLSNTSKPGKLDDAGGTNTQTVQGSGQPADGGSRRGDAGGVSKEDTLHLLGGGNARSESLKAEIAIKKASYSKRSKSSAIGFTIKDALAHDKENSIKSFYLVIIN